MKMRSREEVEERLAEKQEIYYGRAKSYDDNCDREHEMSSGELDDHYDESEALGELRKEIDALRWFLGEIEDF